MITLPDLRRDYRPKTPLILDTPVVFERQASFHSKCCCDRIIKNFPKTHNQPMLFPKGAKEKKCKVLRIGVLFSGGQAPGGHNVVYGLFNAIKNFHSQSILFGFLRGPAGLVKNSFIELSSDLIDQYKNQGGFDLIGSGRTKIESREQLSDSLDTCAKLKLDGLVIVGGDDSNTNAAVLAEYFVSHGSKTSVVGVPKTIDGDLKNDYVDISFGFHTACSCYSEMIGNISRDALSAKKYTHFVKLMGRSASHVALECALRTHPNMTLIGEEVLEKKMHLQDLVHSVADLVAKRSSMGKDYGVIVIPEGIIEFIIDVRALIDELNTRLAQNKGVDDLTPGALKTFMFLPTSIRDQLLLDRDPHGNVMVSHIQTELLLSTLVKTELEKRSDFSGSFSPVHHFFGYEGRSGLPTNFDANYCYTLGIQAANLLHDGHTGYMCGVTNMNKAVKNWKICAIPITSLMNIEARKGKNKAVISKALVDTKSAPFQYFLKKREAWSLGDYYRFPGPIQFSGPADIIDSFPEIINNF